MSKEPLEMTLLANDPGASGERLFGAAGYVTQPAHVALDGQGQMVKLDGLGRRRPPSLIEADGLPPMYVGDDAPYFGRPLQNLDQERQTGTPEMRAVKYAAFTRYLQQCAAGAAARPVKLGVALPNQFITGEEAESNRARVKAWLTGEHHWTADGHPYRMEIAEVVTTSQGAAALFDYLLDGEGNFIPARKDAFKKEVGVISIGFDTIELTVVENKTLFPGLTGGEKLGARRLLRLYDPRELYALSELEPKLRAGRLDVREHLPAWESEILGFVERKWEKKWRRFAAIILVGGGALLLKDTLPFRFHGKACVPEQPTLAVARGLYRLMQLQAHRVKA